MKAFIPISLSFMPKISVQGLVHMVSRIFQSDLSLVSYQYLEFYNSNVGDSSSIEKLTSNSTTFMRTIIHIMPLFRSITSHKLTKNTTQISGLNVEHINHHFHAFLFLSSVTITYKIPFPQQQSHMGL
jgi:hypothetical protein